MNGGDPCFAPVKGEGVRYKQSGRFDFKVWWFKSLYFLIETPSNNVFNIVFRYVLSQRMAKWKLVHVRTKIAAVIILKMRKRRRPVKVIKYFESQPSQSQINNSNLRVIISLLKNIGIPNFINISWRSSKEDLYLFFLAQEVAKVVTSDQTKGVCEKTKLEILLILCKLEILASYGRETG